MPSARSVLLVDPDATYGRTMASVLRRQGDQVRVVRTSRQALDEARRRPYDLAIVDLFVRGGGAELARELARRVPRLLLSLGVRLGRDEALEAALGFPVFLKSALPAVLRGRDASSNGRGSAERHPGSEPPFPGAIAPARGRSVRARRRGRPPS